MNPDESRASAQPQEILSHFSITVIPMELLASQGARLFNFSFF
jgi:hypothetical protein